jgi:hypothetical protein
MRAVPQVPTGVAELFKIASNTAFTVAEGFPAYQRDSVGFD